MAHESGDLGRVSYLTSATHLHVFVLMMPAGPADDRAAARDVRAALDRSGQLIQAVRYASFELEVDTAEERAFLAVLREHGHPTPIIPLHWRHLITWADTPRPDPAAYAAYGIDIDPESDEEEQHTAIRFALACDAAGIDWDAARRGAAIIAQAISHFQEKGYVK